MSIRAINRIFGLLLLALTVVVSVPLTIITIKTNGGFWGFGIIGLGILLPLNTLGLMGVTGTIRRMDRQRKAFVASHVITLLMGIASLLAFPIYPTFVVILPIALAVLGIVSRRRTSYYLFAILVLAIVANIVLLKWELDFNRHLPLLQLLNPDQVAGL